MDQVLDHRKVASPGGGTLRPLFRDSTICQGAFGLRVGDNLLPSDKSQKSVVSSWSMEQWVVDTVPEKKDAFLSGLEFKGEVATSVRYFNSTHLRQPYLGRREIVTNGNAAHIFSWLIILKFDQFPKKQNTQSHSKDSQETKAFLKRKEVWCILTPKKMMLPIHISCLYTANGLTV